MAEQHTELDETGILALTAAGDRELREPGTELTPEQLELLVVIDGHSTAGKVMGRVRAASREQARGNLLELIAGGMVRVGTGDTNYIDAGDFFSKRAEGEQQAEADARFLRAHGYCVHIARRARPRPETAPKELTVLVIDDDPDISMLLG